MSVESLKRVLTKIKASARSMRKEKYASRIAPKPKAPEKTEATAASTTGQIRELLAKG